MKSEASPFRLVAPSIGLDIPVVRGLDNAALRRGPGHDPLSAAPGAPGNCVIAAHRNVYGAPFWYLNKVAPGALLTLQTPRESFRYKVIWARVVPEIQTEILENRIPDGAPPRLTLYTCTLPVSPKRFVVVAELVSREAPAPGDINRAAVTAEITSGPLHLLKDKNLHARYRSLLRYAGEKAESAPPKPSAPPKSKALTTGNAVAVVAAQ